VTAREVLDGIKAREARRQAMIEDGSYRVTQTRCNDPERCGTHFQHPQNVAVETSHHGSYTSHLEALADHSALLTAAVEAVLTLHSPDTYGECRRCEDGPGFSATWPCPTVAAIENALKEGE
jgi:hypothetical protein